MPRILLNRLVCLFAAVAMCTVWTGRLPAQTQSLFGNRGPISQRSSGLSSSSSSTSRFGGSAGLGRSANSFGTSGFGTLGNTSRGNFIGRGDAAAGFVGRRPPGGQNARTTTNRSRNRIDSFGRGRNRSRNLTNSRNASGRGAGRQRTIRPRHRVAFSYPKVDASSISTSLRTQFGKLSSHQVSLNGFTFELDAQQHLTLRGNVDSLESKKLVEMVARLEPGVRSIRNELEVAEHQTSNEN